MEEFNDLNPIFQRAIDGTLTREDAATLRKLLIITGDQNVIQIGNFNINLSGPIDKGSIQKVLHSILEQISINHYDRTLQDYFHALRKYCATSPYLTLEDRVDGESKTIEQIYVPLSLRLVTMTQPHDVMLEQLVYQATLSPDSPHVLIIGDAGGGKSTLLRYIATKSWDDPGVIGLKRPHLAFIIRLQSLVLVEGASIEKRLVNALHKDGEFMLQQDPPDGFLHEWAQRMETHWLFLLDGLDEIPVRKQKELLKWLERLAEFAEEQGHHIFLTSRPMDKFTPEVRKTLTRKKQAPIREQTPPVVYQLLALTSEQQFEIAQRWLGEQAKTFLREVERVRTNSFLNTPLLVTISIVVFRGAGRLGVRPIELYQQFVDIWLDEAEKRGMREELGNELTDKRRQILEHVALITTKYPKKTSMEDLGLEIGDYLYRTWHIPETEAGEKGQRFIEFMSRRSGLFIVQSERYTWLHPTFREYLAARALLTTQSGHWQRVAKRQWTKPQWQSVILFFLALLNNNGVNIESFVKKLSKREKFLGCNPIGCILPPLGGLALAGIMWEVSQLSSNFVFLLTTGLILSIVSLCCQYYMMSYHHKTETATYNIYDDELYFLIKLFTFCEIDKNLIRDIIKKGLYVIWESSFFFSPPRPPDPNSRAKYQLIARQHIARHERLQKRAQEVKEVFFEIEPSLLRQILIELSHEKGQRASSTASSLLQQIDQSSPRERR